MTVELETGDERYAFLNTCLWTASGSRRIGESELPLEIISDDLFTNGWQSSMTRIESREVRD